ncbi:hypothetical protein LOK49_LG12G00775 [Camellia lanceoleosa]|uniref:Uncharacterized protein n=1 Tax=Camellia lanceoleosa TaxID=1840588 RepID=A0ACC0FY63_9ERIC|nr:hypothetical protein LOK49_LG12G00775 [Camellia lanceoleosa]
MATATTKVANIRRSNIEEDVAKDLAAYVANLSNEYIKETNKFTIAVAGGSLIHTLRFALMVLLMPHLFDLVHRCLDLNLHSSVAFLCPVIDLIGLYKEELGSVLIIKLSLIQISKSSFVV